MKADVHFDKAERIATTQSALDPAIDLESIIELCYMSAHHYILAGTEWAGTAHFQSHAHRDNPRLMQQAQTPQDVVQAWGALETLRAGYIYGAKSDVAAGNQARDHLKTIADWSKSLHP